MCGKYFSALCKHACFRGSPPHVREIPLIYLFSIINARITPACAGNTYQGRDRRNKKRDHPRMCGKYYYTIADIKSTKGSPPHVREILPPSSFSFGLLRITPACAGNTLYLKKTGEYFLGSPPHVREIPKWCRHWTK